jgi:lysophospholipase L1-like esterase
MLRVRGLLVLALVAGLAPASPAAVTNMTVVIGDSLSAEYDPIVSVPGISNSGTAYADITVTGWESKSWVEILGEIRTNHFRFGTRKAWPNLWQEFVGDVKMSGYEYNYAIPGVTAGDYAGLLSVSLTNLYWLPWQTALNNDLGDAQRAVIFLGGNEFRGNFGGIYDGTANTNGIVTTLMTNLVQVYNFVKSANASLQICLVNVPDLAATPNKQAAHPDPVKRQRVTAATLAVNQRIASFASTNNLALADVFTHTTNLVNGTPHYFGAVNILYATNADNNPRYEFTRDGLHPNNSGQLEIARSIIAAFNTRYAAGISNLTDAEALAYLGIGNDTPFYEWAQSFGVTQTNFLQDPDRDGANNLLEYALGGNPAVSDAGTRPVTAQHSGTNLLFSWWPDPARMRHVTAYAQQSAHLTQWTAAPTNLVATATNGWKTLTVPLGGTNRYFRLRVDVLAP